MSVVNIAVDCDSGYSVRVTHDGPQAEFSVVEQVDLIDGAVYRLRTGTGAIYTYPATARLSIKRRT